MNTLIIDQKQEITILENTFSVPMSDIVEITEMFNTNTFYIAIDMNGEVWAFNEKPTSNDKVWYDESEDQFKPEQLLVLSKKLHLDWKDCILKVKFQQ